MLMRLPTRYSLANALVVAGLCVAPALVWGQVRGRGAPPTAHGGGYGPHSAEMGAPRGVPGHKPGQEHLAEWMSRHSNLSPAEQQHALEREPGFRELAPNVQQRMRDRLHQLDTMPQWQRQRVLERTEAMERLAPEQRQQIRSSMQQLSSLPPEQRRDVTRAFRAYRSLPPNQRQAVLSSGRLSGPLTPEERSTFNNLLSVEPYLPPPPGARSMAPQP